MAISHLAKLNFHLQAQTDARRRSRAQVRRTLRGSRQRPEIGKCVRIGAQLVDAEAGAHLWVEQYDRVLEDVFALQDEITMCVVGAIEPSLRKVEFDRIRRQRPNSLNAYDLLLQSQPLVFAGMPAEATKAIPLLEEALSLEPEYSAAHAYMSWCMHSRFGRRGLREEDRLAAIRHARAAVRLGNDDATALAIAALALAYDGHDTVTALKVFDRPMELSNCNIFVLCWSAAILAWTGKSELAIERARLAQQLGRFDSLIWRANHALSIAYSAETMKPRQWHRQYWSANPPSRFVAQHVMSSLFHSYSSPSPMRGERSDCRNEPAPSLAECPGRVNRD
jgi:hypothetical protein